MASTTCHPLFFTWKKDKIPSWVQNDFYQNIFQMKYSTSKIKQQFSNNFLFFFHIFMNALETMVVNFRHKHAYCSTRKQSHGNLTRYYKTGNSGWQNKWNRNLSTLFRREVIVADYGFSKSIYFRISMELYVQERHHLFPALL